MSRKAIDATEILTLEPKIGAQYVKVVKVGSGIAKDCGIKRAVVNIEALILLSII